MCNKETVLVKLGWSLMDTSEQFSELTNFLIEVSQKVNLIMTTGSKNLSDIIREYISAILGSPTSLDTHVDITMKSRDMMSKSFADSNDVFEACDSLEDIETIFDNNKIPIIIQYELLKILQPFPLVRGLSTDTTSAFFAYKLWVDKFIKLTNVDWVYKNSELNEDWLLTEVSTNELNDLWKTCIDTKFAEYLDKIKLFCYVMNWYNINNLRKFLNNETSVYTRVYPST